MKSAETHQIKTGTLDMSVAEKETVNISLWAGMAAIIGGVGLLLYASKKGEAEQSKRMCRS